MLALTLTLLVASGLHSPPPSASGTIRGQVTDATTSRPIADVRVLLQPAAAVGEPPPRTAQTTADGRFEFRDVPAGRWALAATTVGYIFVRREVVVPEDGLVEIVIPLSEGASAYTEIVDVKAADTARQAPEATTRDALGPAALQELRGVVFDDPMRAVHALPGVVATDDFNAEFSVRGSALRHVGIVLDETATPLLMHTVRGEANTGSLAMINTDVLEGAELLSGPHARRHGDWLGSTVTFGVREGSRDRTALRAAVSGTAASFVAEGPIGRGRRGSWLVSMRKSYLDWLVRKLEPEYDSTFGFSDGQAKVTWDLTRRQQVQMLLAGGDTNYHENDAGPTNGLDRADAGTLLGSIVWRYTGDTWAVRERASLVTSDYRNSGVRGQELARGVAQVISARTDVSVALDERWTVEGGALVEHQDVTERHREYRATAGGGLAVRAAREAGAETTLGSGWFGVTRRVGELDISGGVRAGGRTGSAEPAIAPWLIARHRFGRFAVFAGGGGARQFADPTFVFLPGEAHVPEASRAFDAGVEHRSTDTIDWRATVFHRDDRDVYRLADEDRLDPVTGRPAFAGPFPVYTASLEGTTDGVDLVVMRRAASGLTGWASYTFAHTRMRDAVTGERFDGDFDQRHTLNVAVTQRLSYRLLVGAKFRVGTNVPIAGYFEGEWDDLRLSAERNLVRLPVYARLDLRVTRTFTFDRRRLTLFVELLNVFARDNYGMADGSIRGSLAATGYVEKLIPFVPSAGFVIEF